MDKDKIVEESKKKVRQATEFGKKLPEKCRCLCKQAQEDPKQFIVALVILLVALFLFWLVFSDRSKIAPKDIQQTKPAVVDVKPVAAPVQEETPAVKEESKEPAPVEETVEPVEEKVEQVIEAPKPVVKIEPKNAVLTFETVAEKDFDYQVFYTVEREVWFDGSHVVNQAGTAGSHKYSIVLPEKEVFRIRLDFGEDPGAITIKNIYLTGSQIADLNDFNQYELNQLEEVKINDDGSLSFVATDRDPYIAYRPALFPE